MVHQHLVHKTSWHGSLTHMRFSGTHSSKSSTSSPWCVCKQSRGPRGARAVGALVTGACCGVCAGTRCAQWRAIVCGQQRRGRRVSSHHSTWRQRGHLLCNSPFSNPTHALVVSQPSTTWEQAFTTTTTTTRWVQRLQSFVAGRHATRKRGLSWSGLVHQARPPSCSS